MYALHNQIEKVPRKRRPRTSLKQLAILQEAYTLDPMPCAAYRELLSHIVGLSSRSIQIWFQNRRQKLKLEENRSTNESILVKKEMALQVLNKAYQEDHNPSDEKLEDLASQVGISAPSIKVWFQNCHAKAQVEEQLTGRSRAASVSSTATLVSNNRDRSPISPVLNSIPGSIQAPVAFIQPVNGIFVPSDTNGLPVYAQSIQFYPQQMASMNTMDPNLNMPLNNMDPNMNANLTMNSNMAMNANLTLSALNTNQSFLGQQQFVYPPQMMDPMLYGQSSPTSTTNCTPFNQESEAGCQPSFLQETNPGCQPHFMLQQWQRFTQNFSFPVYPSNNAQTKDSMNPSEMLGLLEPTKKIEKIDVSEDDKTVDQLFKDFLI